MKCIKRLFISSIVLFLSIPGHTQKISIPFPGDFADPSIVRVGNDYYMTHTSHAYYPGLLVWHSNDLKSWKPVARALHTNVGTVWAPEIVHHNNKFYIYFPTDRGGNYVITADKPEGPWSQPVKLTIRGIDPGHVVSQEGKRYIYVNDGRVAEISQDGQKAVTEEIPVYDGWIYPNDWAVECFCLESPKLAYHNGYYYLVSAQGGTSGPSTSHMSVVARSKNCLGPWENSPYNPLIHTYSPSNTWVSKGHATLFEDAAQQWHIIYHAYDPANRQLGRSTLMESVQWTKDEWPIICSPQKDTPTDYITYANTLPDNDDFSTQELKYQWCFWGLESMNEYRLDNGTLTLNSKEGKTRALMTIAPTADYEVCFNIKVEGNVETGLVLFYNDKEYAGIGMNGKSIYGLARGKKCWTEINDIQPSYFKLRVEKCTLSMQYSIDGKQWATYPHGFDVSGYHTNMLSGFLSMKPAVLCKGEGKIIIDNFIFKTLK